MPSRLALSSRRWRAAPPLSFSPLSPFLFISPPHGRNRGAEPCDREGKGMGRTRHLGQWVNDISFSRPHTTVTFPPSSFSMWTWSTRIQRQKGQVHRSAHSTVLVSLDCRSGPPVSQKQNAMYTRETYTGD
jgi:hypothetical protein